MKIIKEKLITNVIAVKVRPDGTISKVYRTNNPGRVKNVAEGFMAGGVFHPIRHSSDYDAGRVGEGTRKKKKKATTKKRKPVAKKKKRVTATRAKSKAKLYGLARGASGRYSNPGNRYYDVYGITMHNGQGRERYLGNLFAKNLAHAKRKAPMEFRDSNTRITKVTTAK